jgi:large subunit ribosomal protein L10
MPKTRAQKESDYAQLAAKLQDAKSVVFAEYRGTTVKDLDKLRRSLSKEQIFAKVYKVTLIKKALTERGIDASSFDYKAPLIMAVSETDEVSPARIVKEITKDVKTINILSGMMGSDLATREQILALADLPSKDQLRAQLVGTINAPVSGFVNVLAGNVRSLLNVFNAMAQKA